MSDHGTVNILIAEDDDDDYFLTREALDEAGVRGVLHRVRDGEELLEYLRHDGAYHPNNAPRPTLVLLDLNMPRKDGREALQEMKRDPALRSIPVIVLTTSDREEDIAYTYDLGVNSFVQKPVGFVAYLQIVRRLTDYWLQLVCLPKVIP